MNTNDNRLKAHKLIDHIFQDLLPAHGMAQRPEQIQLSHRMLDAMQDGKIALCDAGTGIGKTYAYLAAATAASAFPTGQIARPIIISTSSIALQNAVLTEYLPLLSCVLMADGILTKPLKAVIRKGKSHYVCDERLNRRLRQVNLGKKNPEALAALRTLKETLDMDRVSHLSGYDRERVCVPQVCDCKQRDCRYQRFLKTCDKDQFLFQICNHNLLVADAIHRSEGKRPIFPEHSIIIVDEAHKLPETAQQMLGVTLAAEEIRNLILQLKEERYLLAAEMLEDNTGPLLRKLAQPREEAEPVEACLRLLTAPSCTLPIIQRQIGSLLSPLGNRQLNTVLDAVKLFTSSQTDMIFYTAEDVSTGGAMLCAAAGDITQRIKKILWQPDQAFVLTSGTLAVGSAFIWEFQVTGNDTVPTEEILQALERCGVGVGSRGIGLDQDALRNRALPLLPDVVYLAVNVRGCTAHVQVVERTRPPHLYRDSDVQNVIAEKDGLITRIEALDGVTCTAVGEVVQAGQVLLSGVADSPRGYRCLRATGRVWARTWYEWTVPIPLRTEVKTEEADSCTRLWLDMGRQRIKLCGGGSVLEGNCDKITEYRRLRLPFGVQTPVTLAVERMVRHTAYAGERPEADTKCDSLS